ncbi:MAG TPA: linear amide C-N hydrolase [Thermoanaerobaculia bacterium]
MRAVLALFLILNASIANACTTFCTRGLFGRNYDWHTGAGMLMVNKRNLAKRALGPGGAQWVSRFGSVTFNQYGRDNATGGMNERGLVVEVMWLDATRYPAADKRAPLGSLEWVQYQLDTAASVSEVLDNAKKVRIADGRAPLHYLVADASGDVASIEFLGGKLVVHRGDSLPVPVLANDPYAESLSSRRSSPSTRFARAASGLKAAATLDSAFRLLDEVALGSTQWSIVYDLQNRAIVYRTAKNRERRSVTFAKLDFTCATPLRVLDIDEGRGDVTARFRGYTSAANEALVRRSVRATSFLRNMSEAEIVEAARWPERATCVRAAASSRPAR